jgi:hypothetical protein
MAGYREHSFDPYAYEQPGRPMRPFNWVQWTGVALEVLGLCMFLAYVGGKLGWIAPVVRSGFGFMPMIIGMTLINSRREPGTPAGSEQLQRNRKVLLITIATLAVILGAAVVIESLGAK